MHHLKFTLPRLPALPLLVTLLAAATCDSQEAPRITVPVVVDTTAIAPALTDLGYTVTLTRARMALRDLQFTTGGETHTSLLERAARWALPSAHAHPGHSAGGEITGELTGPLIVDWLNEGAPLGQASLIVGRYQGVNFTFRRAGATEVSADDPLAGHTHHAEGTASKEGRTITFSAVIDIDDGTRLVGARFAHEVKAGDVTMLGLRLSPVDPTDTNDTLWNGIDFFALAGTQPVVAIRPGEGSHNQLRRAFQVHDHYDIAKR